MSRGGPHPVNTVRVEAVKLIRKKKKGFTRTHADTHTSFSALHLCVSSSSPLCCPYRKPPLTSRRLCFCLDLRIEFFRGAPAIKYGIEIAPLFLLRQGVGVGGRGGGTNYLPPSLHYAACFPVSASQVLPPTSALFPRSTTAQTYRNT